MLSQFSRIHLPRGLPVARTCRAISSCSELDVVRLVHRLQVHRRPGCSASRRNRPSRRARRRCRRSCPRRSCGRTCPSTTTRPLVMYSQPWSPRPSTTAVRAGVAHREALAGHAVEERLAAGGAVERHVADQDVLLGQEAWSRAADRRSGVRRRGPCRRSRWRRLPARASRPWRETRRSSGRRSR